MQIIGAGLSGALAGALARDAVIFEAAEQPPLLNHRAVLRFRTDKIGRALNIPFRRVNVLKAILYNRELHNTITPRFANLYAEKVTGKIQSRSINSLEPVERFIAPIDLHQRLLGMCTGRVHYATPLNDDLLRSTLAPAYISTIPLNALCSVLGVEPPELRRAPIHVTRYEVSDCDTFQTLYLPGRETPIYRATLTGDLLIVEATQPPGEEALASVLWGFGLLPGRVRMIDSGEQRYGKITPLPDNQRKALLHHLTEAYGVYSLGRFATWRNVLLDDVFDDFFKIRQLMELDSYDQRRALT